MKETIMMSDIESDSTSPLKRFEKSMQIDYEKWHDGIGYDINAIKSASLVERKAIEDMLINHNPRDWRDIEALSELNTVRAKAAMKKAMKDSNPIVRIAVTRFAPNLVTNRARSQSLIEALERAQVFSGLSQTLDDIEEFHPKPIKEALLKGLLSREGEVAVLFAAMLFYIYGKTADSFDMKLRPFFLTFNTEDRKKRLRAFRALCRQLNINAEKYLESNQKLGARAECY